jgi:hypothetical protein
MKLPDLRQRLAENRSRIATLASGISLEQARWRPSPDAWSILEVINHLHDEEREDFRTRLDLMLHHPDRDFPPIDPAGWVVERRYNERLLDESLAKFLAERDASLAWLKTLDAPDWAITRQAPWGPFRAGDIMAAWVAHDLLHLRQLVELHYAWTAADLTPYQVDYAGPW